MAKRIKITGRGTKPIGLQVPSRTPRPVRRVTGKGVKPIGMNLPKTPDFRAAGNFASFVKLGTAAGKVNVPTRPPRKKLGFSSKVQVPPRPAVRKPLGFHSHVNMPTPPERPVIRPVTGGGHPGGTISINMPRPPRAAPKARWRKSIERPEGFAMPSEENLPPGVETFIDIDGPPIYRLIRATEKHPDHDEDGECQHPKNASSWVACIGLVVLERGGLGLYAKFWNGGEIAYVWPDDDTVIWFYNDWKAARSKGKYIRGRHGPSMLWSQPYVRLS